MSAGLCTQAEQDDCKEQFDEDQTVLQWACENCKKTRLEDLHDYTVRLFKMRALKLGGYPFAKDDLTTEEWLDLGLIEKWDQGPKS